MKTSFIWNFSFAIIIVFFIAGCKKDSDNSFTGCRISSISSGGAVSSIFYDSQGRISHTQSGSWSLTYTYEGNTVTRIHRNNGVFKEKMIYTLDNGGLTMNMRKESDSVGNIWTNEAYEYIGTELIRQTRTTSSNQTEVVNYTWLNGNLLQAENNGIISTYEYYSNELIRVGDYYASNPLNGPGHVIRNRNLIKKVTYTPAVRAPFNLTYLFDSDGKITTRTENPGSLPITVSFQYECN